MLKLLRFQVGERGGGFAKREKIFGNAVRFLQMTCGEILSPAEGDHAALACVTVKLELAERQLAHMREERVLLISADQFRLVAEALREMRRCLA